VLNPTGWPPSSMRRSLRIGTGRLPAINSPGHRIGGTVLVRAEDSQVRVRAVTLDTMPASGSRPAPRVSGTRSSSRSGSASPGRSDRRAVRRQYFCTTSGDQLPAARRLLPVAIAGGLLGDRQALGKITPTASSSSSSSRRSPQYLPEAALSATGTTEVVALDLNRPIAEIRAEQRIPGETMLCFSRHDDRRPRISASSKIADCSTRAANAPDLRGATTRSTRILRPAPVQDTCGRRVRFRSCASNDGGTHGLQRGRFQAAAGRCYGWPRATGSAAVAEGVQKPRGLLLPSLDRLRAAARSPRTALPGSRTC